MSLIIPKFYAWYFSSYGMNFTAETDDKVIKCWVCQEKFTNKAAKFAMHRHVLDELTVKEAIETLLPEESTALQGMGMLK